ncbi:hypothetical protein [Enterobacter cloacae]
MVITTANERAFIPSFIDHSYGVYNFPNNHDFNTSSQARNSTYTLADGFDTLNNARSIAIAKLKLFSYEKESYEVKYFSTQLLFKHEIESEITKNEKSISIKNITELAKDIIGLTSSQLARILKISRATLYNHMSGQSNVNIDPYIPLYEACLDVEKRYGSISYGFKSISIDGYSLLRNMEKNGIRKDMILFYAEEIYKRAGIEKQRNHTLNNHQEKLLNITTIK